jgi:hypothetical protein
MKANAQGDIQRGIFTYLNNRKLSVPEMRMYIKRFGILQGLDPEEKTFFDKVQYMITKDFDAFKEYIKKVDKQHMFDRMCADSFYGRKHFDYQQSWNEKNLDGSFAYNNASDDF